MLQVATWLARQNAVKPGQRVAVCLPMCIASIEITLGILAIGGSFFPLEFNGPPARIDEILASFEPHLIITTNAMAKKLAQGTAKGISVPLVTLDVTLNAFSQTFGDISLQEKPVAVDPGGIAAVFFTSGSTGKPKGAIISYASMAQTASFLTESVPLVEDDRILVLAPLHYASSIGIFYGLFAGCCTHIAAEDEAMFPERVADILEQERITIWDAAATRLRLVVEDGKLEGRNLSAMRYIEFYGEPMPLSSLRTAMTYFPNSRFDNVYGASEAFWMIRFPVPRPLPADTVSIPIGKSMGYYEVSLRNEEGGEVSLGEVGEICVVGALTSICYWNRPDLTAAVRLNGMANSYRTGDLARLGADGNYSFVGRRDHQIKIRGHRFELGEIEAALKSHAEIRDAVAYAVDNNIQASVLADGRDGLVGELRVLCARRLPVFARPVRIHVLPSFPQLTSGKVDRMALQKM
jgi:amino acid adenylation domain-containing protein